ncbi:HD-GYP domain-containing protein [Marinitoga aeolica]|uniref:HD-GYP domain-containing protein n=1 Tax=Marinitoga aeolica TaxID=2809031 RepID=A0ABY8PTX8_9BACT|nr:HD-GYP domain-containing protein [Marinitoga aeolica]WGS65963.1 HD-GYP domain-containing protein [Marinitoga aeolica]
MKKEYLRRWFKNHIKKTFLILLVSIYIFVLFYMIFEIRKSVDTKATLKYQKINEFIISQKNNMVTNSILFSKLYSYSVDNENTLKEFLLNRNNIKGVIDYKPTFDYVNAKYPENINIEEDIKNIIKENLEYIKTHKNYKIITKKDILYIIIPYYYTLVDTNESLFQGILIIEYSKGLLLNSIKNILDKNEYLLSKTELNNVNKRFIKRIGIKFYNDDYYYILDYSNQIKILLFATIILLIIILFLYYLIKYMELGDLEKKIIYPIEGFTKHIEKYEGKPYNEQFEFYEFEMLRQTYNNLIENLNNNKEELEASLEETKAMNEELISLNSKLEEYINKFENVIEIIGTLSLYDKDEKEFFDKLLRISVEIIPEIDYGSIAIRENSEWKFISAYGHDIDKIKLVKFTDETFLYAEKVSIIENIVDKDKNLLSEKDREILEKASKKIKKSILAPLKVNEDIIGQLSLDSEKEIIFSDETIKFVEALSILASFFIKLKRLSKEEGQLHKNIILTLINALEYYDKYTRGHSERVAEIASEFAEFINLNKEDIKRVYWAGITHDIGKFFVPQTILNKPGKLDDDEYEIIKEHPVKSCELLSNNPYLSEYSKIAKHHHERWDGKGYPDGLSGDNIPYIARIITLADSFDAMITIRPYKKAKSIYDVIKDIEKNAGKQFDPDLAKQFIEFLRRKYL